MIYTGLPRHPCSVPAGRKGALGDHGYRQSLFGPLCHANVIIL